MCYCWSMFSFRFLFIITDKTKIHTEMLTCIADYFFVIFNEFFCQTLIWPFYYFCSYWSYALMYTFTFCILHLLNRMHIYRKDYTAMNILRILHGFALFQYTSFLCSQVNCSIVLICVICSFCVL